MKLKGPPRRNYYDLLGVPVGASVQYIKDSYRYLTAKTPITDLAYRTLTDPDQRREYDAALHGTRSQIEPAQDEQDWGRRGRERCDCGTILKADDEWYCQECCTKLDYCVVFDMSGGYIVHEDQVVGTSELVGQPSAQLSYDYTVFGPFTKEEAEIFLGKKNRMRGKTTD
jgi:curved DNA-binding protein CbpA